MNVTTPNSNVDSIVQSSLPAISTLVANGQVGAAEQLFQDLALQTGDPNLQSLASQSTTTLSSPSAAGNPQTVAQLQAQLQGLQVEFPDLASRIQPMLAQLQGVSTGLTTSSNVSASPQNPIAGLLNQLNTMVASGASPSAIATMQAQIINVMNAGGASVEQTGMMKLQFQMQSCVANGGAMSDYQNAASSFFGMAVAAGSQTPQLALLQAQVLTALSPSAANALLTQGIANGAFSVVGGPYGGSQSPSGPVASAPIVTAPTTPVYTAPTTTYATPTYTSYAPVISQQYGGTNSVINQGIANGAFSTALTPDQQNMLSQAQAAGASGPQLAMMQLQMQMENQQEVLQAISKIFNMLDQTAKAIIQNF
jgi:hypothetical protein